MGLLTGLDALFNRHALAKAAGKQRPITRAVLKRWPSDASVTSTSDGSESLIRAIEGGSTAGDGEQCEAGQRNGGDGEQDEGGEQGEEGGQCDVGDGSENDQISNQTSSLSVDRRNGVSPSLPELSIRTHATATGACAFVPAHASAYTTTCCCTHAAYTTIYYTCCCCIYYLLLHDSPLAAVCKTWPPSLPAALLSHVLIAGEAIYASELAALSMAILSEDEEVLYTGSHRACICMNGLRVALKTRCMRTQACICRGWP